MVTEYAQSTEIFSEKKVIEIRETEFYKQEYSESFVSK